MPDGLGGLACSSRRRCNVVKLLFGEILVMRGVLRVRLRGRQLTTHTVRRVFWHAVRSSARMTGERFLRDDMATMVIGSQSNLGKIANFVNWFVKSG